MVEKTFRRKRDNRVAMEHFWIDLKDEIHCDPVLRMS